MENMNALCEYTRKHTSICGNLPHRKECWLFATTLLSSLLLGFTRIRRQVLSLRKTFLHISANMVLASVSNLLFKRTSTFALTMVVGAFFFERTVDLGADWIFDTYNKGKLWKDIAQKYEQ